MSDATVIIKRHIKETKKSISGAKKLYKLSVESLGQNYLMARSYRNTMIRRLAELRLLEKLQAEMS